MSASDPNMKSSPDRGGAGMKAQVMSALRWSAIAKFGGQLVNWGMTLVVIRLLTPADYGLVAMLTILFMFLNMLGDMGFGSSITQAADLSTKEIRQTFGAALIVNVLIGAALILLAPAVASFYVEPRLVEMTQVSALGFIANGFYPVYNGLLQREMRFRTIAQVDIISAVLTNVTTLGCALAGYGAWALIFGGLLGAFVRVLLLMFNATKHYWPSFRFDGSRRLWTFGGHLLVNRIVWYWLSQADLLIAAKFLGKDALGFYSVALHLASLPMQRASGIINTVAFAAFSKIQHDPRAVAHNTRLAVRLMAFVTFPVLWGIGAIAPELVRVAVGPTWEASILPLTLVALTIPFRMIGAIVATTIMSMGRVDIITVTMLIGVCIAPPLFFLGSHYGIVGLSVAWLVVAPILFLLNMFRALPIVGLSLHAVATELWRPLTSSAVMFVAVGGGRLLLKGVPDVAMLPLLVMVGAVVYCGCAWLMNRTATVEALVLLFPGRFAHLRVADTPAS